MSASLRARMLGVAAAAALSLVAPAAAGAATLSLDASGNYVYTAGTGFSNDLNFSGQTGVGGSLFIMDNAGDNITFTGSASGACSYPEPANQHQVNCATAPVTLVANLGPSDALPDRVQASLNDQNALTVNGGGGNDVLSGLGTLNGDAGDDILGGTGPNSPASNANVQNGGPGNDTMLDSDSPNTTNGDTGVDTVKFFAGFVNVTIDGVANDGQNGNDNVGLTTENVVGTPGDDHITGRTGALAVANRLTGGAGDDVLTGLDGNDVLDGGTGADEFNGGGGSDTVDYSRRSAPVQVLIGNNAADDGEAGEGDSVKIDMERAIGGFASDHIVGQPGNFVNVFDGGLGADTLEGGSANDTLRGGAGPDEIDGQLGDDTVNGQSGNDSVDGGVGTDNVSGEGGFDLLEGGSGADTVSGGDGSDQLFIKDNTNDTSANCGDGTDKVVHDAIDSTINANCETKSTTFAAALKAALL